MIVDEPLNVRTPRRADLDLEALLVLVSTLSYGYALLRDVFADELEVSAVELDWRIDALLESLLATRVEPD